MIEFNKEDLPDEHEYVDSETLSEQDKTEVHTWHIYLRGGHNIRSQAVTSVDRSFNEQLGDKLIPERAEITTLSFFFEGTYEEALIAGHVMCDKLNKFDSNTKPWFTDRDSVMLIEDTIMDSNDGP